MQQKLTWLRASLFTKKYNWHHLLVAIESFISQNSASVVDFSVEFNFLCGENIRLAVLVLEDSVNQFVPVMDNYFKNFFAERKLRMTPTLLPVAGIFKPFDQNTIQYGLFDIPTSTIDTKFSANLSRIILTALKDDVIDDETIITLGFYLHTGILKVSKERSELSDEIESYHVNSVSLTRGDISIEFLLDKFKSNAQELINIYQHIVVEKQSELPDWMIDWIGCVKDEIESYSGTKAEILQIEKYYKVISIVNRQLGISDNSWLLISYLLEQTSNAFHAQN